MTLLLKLVCSYGMTHPIVEVMNGIIRHLEMGARKHMSNHISPPILGFIWLSL